VQQAVQRIREVLDGCGFRHVDDLKGTLPADKSSRHLRGRIGKPRNNTDRGISAQTATFLLAEARRFVRWLSRRGTGVPALFDSVTGFDPANERTHARRELSPDELGKPLDAAKVSARSYRGPSGPDRHALYLAAFATGFRKSELAALTPAHFYLGDDPHEVTLPGKVAKNKKSVRQPIPPEVAVRLRGYLAGKPANDSIWPGKWKDSSAAMLRLDLASAGVPYAVESPAG
jgi:integrase